MGWGPKWRSGPAIGDALSALAAFDLAGATGAGGSSAAAREPRSAGICPRSPSGCDASTPYLRHSAVSTDDNLCLQVEQAPDPVTLAGRLRTINHSGRWVFHYIDDPTVPVPTSWVDGFTGVSFPRQYAIPSVLGLMWDLGGAAWAGFSSLWSSDDSGFLQEVLTELQERAGAYVDPQESSFELLPLGHQRYQLTSVGGWPGKGPLPAPGSRVVLPFVMTYSSQVLVPAVSLVFDLGKVTFPGRRNATIDLLRSFSEEAAARVTLAMQTFSNPGSSLEEQLGALADVGFELLQNREFIAWLSRTGLGVIESRLREKTAKWLFEQMMVWLKPVNISIGAVNFGLSIGDLFLCASDVDLVDTYDLDFSSGGGGGGECDSGRFPATGQTTCWNSSGAVIPCAGTGHDGDIRAGAPLSYTDNGDGTITDLNTGLMWEKLSDDGSIHDKDAPYTWDNAFSSKIATLNSTSFAGYNDWRVPNVKELQSIVNYEFFYPAPAVAAAFNGGCSAGCSVTGCSCTIFKYHWSSSTYAGNPTYAWGVSFDYGQVFARYGADGPHDHFVRAVRGCTSGGRSFPATGQTTCWNSSGSVIACAGTGHDGDIRAGAPLSYRDNGDGTITDLNTGLMWEKLSNDGSIHDMNTSYTWDNAFSSKIATLSSTSFAGYNDWRVPNVKELLSIVNYELFYAAPAVAAAFNSGCSAGCSVTGCSCTGSGLYWSSSTFAQNPYLAWHVQFGNGHVDAFHGDKNFDGYVRAVRGGS